MITCVGGGPAAVLPAKSWGSHASRLIRLLREGHDEVRLSSEEMERLITWVDLNAPYYPTDLCAFPDHLAGRCPLTPDEIRRLTHLTGVDLNGLASHSALRQPWVSFDRPELSPLLARIPAERAADRAEALTILRRGADRLKATPEADRPGFVPCATDRVREERYARRQQAELRSRAAIREGKKCYDE